MAGRGENGELRVGVRRAMRQQTNVPSSVISSHSMHLGVLATAWHAVNTGTMFTVYYKPRSVASALSRIMSYARWQACHISASVFKDGTYLYFAEYLDFYLAFLLIMVY